MSTDDFLDVFEEATRYVITERQDLKRQMFKNILANSITSPVCDYDKTERYFRLLNNLGELELKVLAVLANPEEYNKSHGMVIKPGDLTGMITVTSMGVLTQLLGLKVHEIEDTISVLFTNGLVIENSMGSRLQTNGNPIHVLKNLLTTRGINFVKYLNE